ncbi:MAG: hypothetical protein U1C33_03850, partial [Candidatus Cloacimonadaceae bacterium]|nr:hypothetical protein [Candidatus Cloacimonadaceae bacterium]
NDLLLLSGRLDISDLSNFSASLFLKETSSEYLQNYLEFLEITLPEFDGLSLSAAYNRAGKYEIDAQVYVQGFDMEPLHRVSGQVGVQGTLSDAKISGSVSNRLDELIIIEGTARALPSFDLDINARTSQLSLDKVLREEYLDITLDADLGFSYHDILGTTPQMTMHAKVFAVNAIYDDIVIDSLVVDVSQSSNVLSINNVRVYAGDLIDLRIGGSLDYNILSNTFFEGNRELELELDLELMCWLKNNIAYIEDAKGKTHLNVSIGTFEDEFSISKGRLAITNASVKLADQIDPITDFRLIGDIQNNKFTIRDASFKMGLGSLGISNYFEPEPSDHFMVGPLDLGIMQIRTHGSGLDLHIPEVTPPRTLSRVVIKGRNNPYLIVKGPFDNMKIKGDVVVSNANIVFPSNTDNLLKMAYSVRQVAVSKPSSGESLPLPFVLDAMITIQDNTRYLTYPVNIEVTQNSFLHLLYDGQQFIVNEANFTSERGTIDFFGTIFQVDFISVTMIDTQNIMEISGSFFRRAYDGTMISLNITTSRDTDKDILSRLEFNLTSDNPQDRTITDIISRLRYNESAQDLSRDQRQSLLQDEAFTMISQNLDSSILTPFFYPIENRIRRFLRLDNFSIKAGFIQNLYTEYSTDSSQFSEFGDMKSLDNDIVQLSSSILLNNLSLSMSKYLGRKTFIDYKLSLQEATDLSKKTRLLVSHDTSLRFLLPWRLRIAYTLKYEAVDDNISHEVMLQRTFRF